MKEHQKLDKLKVVEIFNKMEYCDASSPVNLAQEWLERKNIKTEGTSEAVLNTLTNEVAIMVEIGSKFVIQGKSVGKINIMDQIHLFDGIRNKLKANTNLIVQLEMTVRGFLAKDAMKSFNLFLNYLEHYSTLTSANACRNEKLKLMSNTPLAHFGNYLGKLLSGSKSIYVQAEPKFYVIARAIFEIIQEDCEKYGITCELEAIQGNNIDTDNTKTPVLVFNDADFDSAIESIVIAAFAEQGQMPWSVNTVIVQEDVIDEFISKLKHRLEAVTSGACNNKQADISYPYLVNNFDLKYSALLTDAKSKGLEIFQPKPNLNGFQPTLLWGGKIYGNNLIKKKPLSVPYINVLSFRSIKEGIALCNNQNQTFAATLWSENVGLLTEIIHKLDGDNIWINAHGVFNANVQYYFGSNNPMQIFGGSNRGSIIQEGGATLKNDIVNKISKAKQAQIKWSGKTFNERITYLRNIAPKLYTSLQNRLNDDLVEDWMKKMFNLPFKMELPNSVQIYNSLEIKQFKKPLGVVYYVPKEKDNFREHIFSALLDGNAIIVQFPQNKMGDDFSFLEQLAECMQDLVVIFKSDDIFNLQACQVFEYDLRSVDNDTSYLNFNRLKTVWTSIGEQYV